MSKIYRASVTTEIHPDENGLADWEDGYDTENPRKTRTEQELLDFAKSELLECLFNALKYNDLAEMITVEVVQDDR